MSKTYPVPAAIASQAHLDAERYARETQRAARDPEAFWGGIGQRLDWLKPYPQVSDVSYDKQDLHIRWYADGELNVCVNCVDRHLADKADQVAILWEGDDPARDAKITYRELHAQVC